MGVGQMEGPLIVTAVAAILCTAMPLDLSQLVFMVIGALVYALLQALQQQPLPVGRGAAGGSCAARGAKAALGWAGPRGAPPPAVASRAATTIALGARGGRAAAAAGAAPGWRNAAGSSGHGSGGVTEAAPVAAGGNSMRQEVRTLSSMPIMAPVFAGAGWEAEVGELLGQITPTAESDKIVQQLAHVVKLTIRRTIPEVEVMGFASGDLARGKAFGVAVPDVDIVINVSPSVLVARLQGRLSQGRTTVTNLDSRRLQKSAIRVCTDKLVTQGGFKFRRSAFRGQEPKVTLLAPASLGIFDVAVPVDFTVNSLTPLYNAALLTECGQIDARAKALILLVKRWSKDRGICHAAKGHLPPYLWSLLTIYYLQLGVPGEGAILPPLEAFEVSSGLMKCAQAVASGGDAAVPRPKWRTPVHSVQTPVGELFKGFMIFYSRQFDWRNEAVSVRRGRRAPPDLRLPLHIILHDDGCTTEVGPSIEDPFDGTNNLGTCMTAGSIARLREELRRADMLCSSGGSLSQLLEPWIPPEHDASEHGREEHAEEFPVAHAVAT